MCEMVCCLITSYVLISNNTILCLASLLHNSFLQSPNLLRTSMVLLTPMPKPKWVVADGGSRRCARKRRLASVSATEAVVIFKLTIVIRWGGGHRHIIRRHPRSAGKFVPIVTFVLVKRNGTMMAGKIISRF